MIPSWNMGAQKIPKTTRLFSALTVSLYFAWERRSVFFTNAIWWGELVSRHLLFCSDLRWETIYYLCSRCSSELLISLYSSMLILRYIKMSLYNKNNILLLSSFSEVYPPKKFFQNLPSSSFSSNDRSHAREFRIFPMW
jgi:hypothetical protein